MSADLVRVLTDPDDDDRYETVPRHQVPAGYIRVHIRDRGEFFTDPSWLKDAPELRHGPFPEAARVRLRGLQDMLADVYSRTLEQWEEGFRGDTHPWREVALWEMMAAAFRKFTRHLAGSDEMTVQKRKDVLGLILSFVTNGAPDLPPGVRFGSTGTVTAARVGEIHAYLHSEGKNEFRNALVECRAAFRELILAAGFPNRISVHALFGEGMKKNPDAAFDPDEYLATADLILAEDVDTKRRCVVYGKDLHSRLVTSAVGDQIDVSGLRVVTIEIDRGTDELQRLAVLVEFLKGRHDLRSAGAEPRGGGE